jgi:hypothetical protein
VSAVGEPGHSGNCGYRRSRGGQGEVRRCLSAKITSRACGCRKSRHPHLNWDSCSRTGSRGTRSGSTPGPAALATFRWCACWMRALPICRVTPVVLTRNLAISGVTAYAREMSSTPILRPTARRRIARGRSSVPPRVVASSSWSGRQVRNGRPPTSRISLRSCLSRTCASSWATSLCCLGSERSGLKTITVFPRTSKVQAENANPVPASSSGTPPSGGTIPQAARRRAGVIARPGR